jgi:hypothetical protein
VHADAGCGVEQTQTSDAIGVGVQVELGHHATPGVPQQMYLIGTDVFPDRFDIGDVVGGLVAAVARGAADAALI